MMQRIVLKISGEMLGGQNYTPEMVEQVATELRSIAELGCQVAVVLGGGNARVCRLRPAHPGPVWRECGRACRWEDC